MEITDQTTPIQPLLTELNSYIHIQPFFAYNHKAITAYAMALPTYEDKLKYAENILHVYLARRRYKEMLPVNKLEHLLNGHTWEENQLRQFFKLIVANPDLRLIKFNYSPIDFLGYILVVKRCLEQMADMDLGLFDIGMTILVVHRLMQEQHRHYIKYSLSDVIRILAAGSYIDKDKYERYAVRVLHMLETWPYFFIWCCEYEELILFVEIMGKEMLYEEETDFSDGINLDDELLQQRLVNIWEQECSNITNKMLLHTQAHLHDSERAEKFRETIENEFESRLHRFIMNAQNQGQRRAGNRATSSDNEESKVEINIKQRSVRMIFDTIEHSFGFLLDDHKVCDLFEIRNVESYKRANSGATKNPPVEMKKFVVELLRLFEPDEMRKIYNQAAGRLNSDK